MAEETETTPAVVEEEAPAAPTTPLDDELTAIFAPYVEEVVDVVEDVVGEQKEVVIETVEAIAEEVADKIEAVIEVAEDIVADVASESVVADVVESIGEVAEAVVEKVEEAVEVVAEQVEVVAEEVKEVAEIVEAVAENVEAVAEKVEAVAEEVKEEAAAVVESISEALAPSEEIALAPSEEVAPAVEVTPILEALVEELAPVETEFIVLEPPPAIVETSPPVAEVVAPSRYADLGKEAADLYSKNYHIGVMNLKKTTKSADEFEFTTEGTHNTSSGLVGASLETKYLCSDCGISLKSKWNTDSVVMNTICLENKGAQGLNIDLDTAYSLLSGSKSLKVKSAYTGSALVHPTLDIDFSEFTKPKFDFSMVLAHQGLHAGYQTSFDTASSSFAGHNLTLAYKTPNVIINGTVANASKFIGSVYYNIRSGLSAAAHVEYASGSSSPTVAVSGKYDLSDGMSVKARLDGNMSLGMSYITTIRSGIQLTVTSLLNGKSLLSGSEGGHKVGLSLNFEA